MTNNRPPSNESLSSLARRIQLERIDLMKIRLDFGLECAESVRRFLNSEFQQFLDEANTCRRHLYPPDDLHNLWQRSSSLKIPTRRRWFGGATDIELAAAFTVLEAVQGNALQAASYAAEATALALGSAGVLDPSAYQDVYRWQVETLLKLSTAGST